MRGFGFGRNQNHVERGHLPTYSAETEIEAEFQLASSHIRYLHAIYSLGHCCFCSILVNLHNSIFQCKTIFEICGLVGFIIGYFSLHCVCAVEDFLHASNDIDNPFPDLNRPSLCHMTGKQSLKVIMTNKYF